MLSALRPIFWRQRSAQMLLGAALLAFLTFINLALRQPERVQPPIPNPVELSAEETVIRLQTSIERNPENSSAYAELGLAYLQRLRETADASYYSRAEMAFAEALKRDPNQLGGLIGEGTLALSRHDFAGGLKWGEQAHALYPYNAEILGIIVDAQVELGRYPNAVATAQTMVDLRPGISSYSRVSYLRELHGEVDGAIEAMRAAAAADRPESEASLWSQVQLGNLYFNRGDLRQAEAIYRQALRYRPDYPYAQAGLANVQASHGDYASAIATYLPLTQRLPLPAFVIALGDLYTLTGQYQEAQTQYNLVRVIERLNASAGVDVDLELGLFDADYGEMTGALLARAQALYSRRPTVYAADVLAWTLYRSGDYTQARSYSKEALGLGTRDARLYYHAGMIALAVGETREAARLLAEALDINPYFNLIQARAAREALEQIGRAQ